MSADGEIEVAVKADGVDDAAGEMGSESLAEGDGGGSGGGVGGLRLGRLVTLLTSMLGLLTLLQPVLDVLGVVSEVLTAFVAPLAVILMRALMPLIRGLTQVLPAWLSFFEDNEQLLTQILQAASILLVLPKLLAAFNNLRAWLTELPGRIATELKTILPTFGSDGGPSFPTPTRRDAVQFVTDTANDATGGRFDDAADTVVSIGGGLSTFINEITTDGQVDFP